VSSASVIGHLFDRVGVRADGAALEARVRFLVRDNATNRPLYAGIDAIDAGALADTAFASPTTWASWALAGALSCLFVQLERNDGIDGVEQFLVSRNRATWAVRRDARGALPFEFHNDRQLLVLQAELVEAVDGSHDVVLLVTECLWNRVYRGNKDRATRMATAHALVDGEPFRAPPCVRRADAGDERARFITDVIYKPHMTALTADAVVRATPPALRRFNVVGIAFRDSTATHTPAPLGVSEYTLPLTGARTERVLELLRHPLVE